MGEVVKVASAFDQADFTWLVKSASYDSPHNANFVQHLSESKESILTIAYSVKNQMCPLGIYP